MQNFHYTLETRKRSFISAFSICMTVPLSPHVCYPLDKSTSLPADTDVCKTSSGRLKKVTTSCDQTRRRHDVWKKTSDLRRLEDV